MNNVPLPAGFYTRLATFDDAAAVAALMNLCDAADGSAPETTAEDIASGWRRATFNLETDLILVTTEDGSLAAFEEFYAREPHVRVIGDGYVHPQYRGRGLGSGLLAWLEQRVLEHQRLAPPGSEVVVHNGIIGRDLEAQRLFEDFGYRQVRNQWRMSIDLQAAPPDPAWPQGVELRPFRQGQDEHPVFAATEEGFRDHWGYTPWNYEDWVSGHHMDSRDFDPSLWFIAWEGDEIAGTCLCRLKEDGGWVNQLAVRRPWRKRGLGLALLYQAFGEFYRRGVRHIGLGVDAESPTGATRLYERAGMQVSERYIVYGKEVPAGEAIKS